MPRRLWAGPRVPVCVDTLDPQAPLSLTHSHMGVALTQCSGVGGLMRE